MLQQAETACRRLAKSHYENFLVGTLFIPRAIRQDFFNLYAYCRTADDLADESPSPEAALTALRQWRSGFLQCIDAELPLAELPHPIFVALRHTIQRHRLPPQPFLDLLEAFEQDQTVTQYATFDQLLEYCRRSANPVGRLVLRLGGCDDPALDALSDRICTGLQLANFCQDVRRDRVLGRVYLPAEDRQRFGVAESDLDAPRAGEPLKQLLRFEVERTADYLRGGLPLADRVPRWLARDIRLFAHGGLETLRAIRRGDYDVLQRRPRVTRWRQVLLLGRAAVGRLS
ncbi:squalene synthase HpnC [Roseimaritima ulvae]|uniref:squalene synthase HpnC n=1 Tax=Roseimaritima ulvae TaxID=980254 RepID=UPI001EE3C013|nr:squalene synthase HpnC [Roseimaritima ulvae]